MYYTGILMDSDSMDNNNINNICVSGTVCSGFHNNLL